MNRLNIDVEEAIRLYNSGKSQREVAKILNCTQMVIRDRFREVGFQSRDTLSTTKKYSYNETYFEKIDSPDKAYFLGLLYADGWCSTSKNYKMGIGLQESDIDILKLFRSKINATNPLKIHKSKDGKYHDSYRFIIHSKKIALDLASLGCVERKSLILKFPTEEQVPKYLLSHFIRGYFDGDGSIGTYNNKNLLTIVGTKEFLNMCVKIIENLGTKSATIRKQSDSNVYTIVYGSYSDILKIRDWLYKDCENLYLKRKKEKFDNLSLPYIFNNTKLCTVDGCQNKQRCKGLCQHHYNKQVWKKYRNIDIKTKFASFEIMNSRHF